MNPANALPPPRSGSEFMQRVLCLAALYSCSVTSFARTEQRNAAVGGVPNSWHRLARGGLGLDLVLDQNDEAHRAELCLAGRQLGLYMLDEGDHCHANPGS